MPELPEAQTIAAFLAGKLPGQGIRSVQLRRRDFLKTGSTRQLQGLAGCKIMAVGRHGKYVIIQLEAARLVLQLGMAGRVFLVRPDVPEEPHTHLVIVLDSGLELRYANSRRIASGVHVLRGEQPGPLAGLGADALAISAADFAARVAGHRTAIKATIMNQAVLAGVGNIYSDEALFRVGIRPSRAAYRVKPDQLRQLHGAIRQVLKQAIAKGGSTFGHSSRFAGVDGDLGSFTMHHQVYGRYGQPCVRCGATLRRSTIGGRTSTFCPRCQK